MADFTYGTVAGAGPSPRFDLTSTLNWTGAAVSLALIAGLGWWGYSLAVRDVTGVPVVRALEGPMRVAPTDPGGTLTDHQGLAVNAVAADGVAAGAPDRVILAPKPLDLAAEDGTQPELAERVAERRSAEAEAAIAAIRTPEADLVSEADPAPAAVPPDDADPESSAIELALAEALGLPEAEVIPAVARVEAGDAVAAADPAPAAIPASVGGVSHSPRPAPRPEGDGVDPMPLQLASAQPYLSRPEAGVPSLADQKISVGAGGSLVQLGAFDTTEQADTEWTRLIGRFPEYLGDKPKVIEEARSNGRTFYRLRAGGFEDLADARRFCAALVAGNAACIPVTAR